MRTVNKLLKTLFVASCAWALVPSFPANAQWTKAQDLKLPVPQIETLPNGLQVVWFISENLPIVDLGLLVKSGYRDDPAGKTGTSALVSALLDRGAAGMTSQQIARSIEMLGASRYVASEDDTFNVGVHGLAPDAPALLDLLAKMTVHPDFPEAEVKREQARILDQWNHLGDYGDTLVDLAYRRLLTAGTSYGRGSFESIREFNAITRDDVLAYYRRNFTPKNAILMVVGRVNQAEFRSKILADFGTWQGEAPKKEWKSFIDPRLHSRPGEVLVIDRPDLTQAQVRIGFKAPLIQVPEHYALVVANALLGEYFNSRLNSLIRDKLGLTYAIGSSFSYSKDFAGFTISSATRNEKVGQLIRKSVEVLKGLKHGPIPEDEVRMAKDFLVGGFPLSTAILGAVAARWLGGYVFDLGPDYLNEFIPKVSQVTREDVALAVTKDLDLDHLVIVVAGDAKEIEHSLREAKFTSIRQASIHDLM